MQRSAHDARHSCDAIYDRWIVENEGGPDLEFEGEPLVDETHGDIGRVRIFRSRRGRYIARQERSALRGTPHVNRSGVFDDLDALARWLGHSAGAKSVLERIGKPQRIVIE